MIGLVDVEVLRAEASRGIAVLAEGADPRESQAASLIAYLSLQDPRLLASDLDLLRGSWCKPRRLLRVLALVRRHRSSAA